MNHMNNAEHCKCSHHKVGAILIIVIGLTFLLGVMNVLSPMVVAYAWPILVIVFGVTRLMGGSCKCYMRS